MSGRGAFRVVLLAALLAACANDASSGPAGVAFEGEGVRFTAPAGWHVEGTGAAAGGAHWLVYVATQEIHDRCGASPSGSCLPPLDELRSGGVLIAWYTRNCAGPDCTLPDGGVTRVGGREAATTVGHDSCGTIGETEETDYHVAVSPQRIDTIVVCGREVSETTHQTVRLFLDAVVWRTP